MKTISYPKPGFGMRIKMTLLTAGVFIASSGAVHAAMLAHAKFGKAWKPVDCKTFDVPAAVAAQSDCGYVTVPEQHAQPQRRSIQLAVVRIRSTSKCNDLINPDTSRDRFIMS